MEEKNSFDFHRFFIEHCAEHVGEAVTALRHNSPKFLEKETKAHQLQSEVRGKLQDDCLWISCMDAMNETDAAQESTVYRQGMLDCIFLLRMLGILKN